ncbi:uncharacterized protein KZ484_013126 [Pholidichthys leucotaenia]
MTIETLKAIKDAGDSQPPGSFLEKLHQDLDDPRGLGAFSIRDEEVSGRRGQKHQQGRMTREKIMDPYISGLVESLVRWFQHLGILAVFSVLGPQALKANEDVNVTKLKTLVKQFLQEQEDYVLQEWASFKYHLLIGAFKEMDQQSIMTMLACQNDEWGQLYPSPSQLAAIALTVPISSVNCERDISTMNRVKTDLRNRLQGGHLAAYMRLSINGPPPKDFPYQRALELFYQKPRRLKCNKHSCKLCCH